MKKAKKDYEQQTSELIKDIENYLDKFSKTYNETIDLLGERHNLQNKFDLKVIEKFRQINIWNYVNCGIGIMALVGVVILALIQYGII